MSKHHRLILLAGFITGLAALGLTAAGNPANIDVYKRQASRWPRRSSTPTSTSTRVLSLIHI